MTSQKFNIKEEVIVTDFSVTDEDLMKVFNTYASHHAEDVEGGKASLKPLQFSSIWRLISGEKGNLYKEMQMFKK